MDWFQESKRTAIQIHGTLNTLKVEQDSWWTAKSTMFDKGGMVLMDHGSDFQRGEDPSDVTKWLVALHKIGRVHRDLRLPNVMRLMARRIFS